LLDNGALGRLAPVANAAQLAAGICELIRSDNARKEFSQEAEASARTKFSLGKMVDLTEQVYREVLL
jgi:glycosyltransferase involved in cell wall biosynthesis